jgi:hypothetical protein
MGNLDRDERDVGLAVFRRDDRCDLFVGLKLDDQVDRRFVSFNTSSGSRAPCTVIADAASLISRRSVVCVRHYLPTIFNNGSG